MDEEHDIGWAMAQLREHRAPSREGWPEGMYLERLSGDFDGDHIDFIAVVCKDWEGPRPWMPTQTDLFAKDWRL